MIVTESIFKDYGEGKGVFGLSINIEKGETFGFLGPNGAGKTTTLRMLLGFIRPDSGKCSICGMDSFSERKKIMSSLGYLPAEINFFEGMTGSGFLDFMGRARCISDTRYMEELIDFLELDPKAELCKMSKGTRQKVAIVAAFMHRPEILILDEPTSGLDPLMQSRFNELVTESHNRGATILMSSHNFEEVEKTCGKVGIIKSGKLVTIREMDELKLGRSRRFTIEFASADEMNRFRNSTRYTCSDSGPASVTADIGHDMDAFIRDLSGFSVNDLRSVRVSLEEMFMQYYSQS